MRRYSPNPKHEQAWIVGVKSSYLDLTQAEAEALLNDDSRIVELARGAGFIGVTGGKLYLFRGDNAGGYHAYPITGNEVDAKFPEVKHDVAMKLGVSVKRLSRMYD